MNSLFLLQICSSFFLTLFVGAVPTRFVYVQLPQSQMGFFLAQKDVQTSGLGTSLQSLSQKIIRMSLIILNGSICAYLSHASQGVFIEWMTPLPQRRWCLHAIFVMMIAIRAEIKPQQESRRHHLYADWAIILNKIRCLVSFASCRAKASDHVVDYAFTFVNITDCVQQLIDIEFQA